MLVKGATCVCLTGQHLMTSFFAYSDHTFLGLLHPLVPEIPKFITDLIKDMPCCPDHLSRSADHGAVIAAEPLQVWSIGSPRLTAVELSQMNSDCVHLAAHLRGEVPGGEGRQGLPGPAAFPHFILLSALQIRVVDTLWPNNSWTDLSELITWPLKLDIEQPCIVFNPRILCQWAQTDPYHRIQNSHQRRPGLCGPSVSQYRKHHHHFETLWWIPLSLPHTLPPKRHVLLHAWCHCRQS